MKKTINQTINQTINKTSLVNDQANKTKLGFIQAILELDRRMKEAKLNNHAQ